MRMIFVWLMVFALLFGFGRMVNAQKMESDNASGENMENASNGIFGTKVWIDGEVLPKNWTGMIGCLSDEGEEKWQREEITRQSSRPG